MSTTRKQYKRPGTEIVCDRSRRRRIPAIAILLGYMAAAHAQSTDTAAQPAAQTGGTSDGAAPANWLPDIVVTATRRSEVLSKVPISVSAFSQESLTQIGARDFVDLARFTPGVTIDAAGTNNISIRGISSSAGTGTTGIYIDDTPIQMRFIGYNSDDALPKAFDLDRIEVLRGPQGTLFGAGAEGGAVRYILAQPSLITPNVSLRSEVSTTNGGAASYEAGIAAGAPVVDNRLGVRGSIWYRRDGGWVDRLDPFTGAVAAANSNYSDTVAARLAAKWVATDAITVTPSLMYQDIATHGESVYFPYLSNPGAQSYRNAFPDSRPQPDRFFLPALKVESDFNGVALVSNTSYFTRRELGGYTGTLYNFGYYQTFSDPANPFALALTNPAYYPFVSGGGLNPLLGRPLSAGGAGLAAYRAPATLTNKQENFTQEVRLQSADDTTALSWTTGIFFSVNRQTSIEEINDPMIGQFFQALYGVPYVAVFGESLLPNGDAYYNHNFSRDRQIALFGEAIYAVTPKLKLTGGLRISKASVDFDHFADGPQNFGTTPQQSGSQSDRPITPKASLSYQPDAANLFYATYARGFRIGGANAPIPVSSCAFDLGNLGLSGPPDSYKSDSVQSYELGAKSRLAEHLRIASSVYYITWSGIQQKIFLPTCGFQFTANLGRAVSKGADIQIEFAPTDSIDIDIALGHTDARYSADAGTNAHLIAAKGDAVEGQATGGAPPWMVALGSQWNFTSFNHRAFIRLDYEFQGHNSVTSPSEDPRTAAYDPHAYTAKAYSFVSARAGVTVDKWSIAGFVDNAFNAHPQVLDSSDPHTAIDAYNPNPPSVLVTAYTLRPRTIGISAAYHL